MLNNDLREFIVLLNSHGVDYLIVGAHAMACHGVPRFTGDLDVFIRVSTENARKMENVLAEFGFAETGLRAEDFLVSGQVVQLGRVPNRIDILTSITGVTFDEAWPEKTAAQLDGLPVFILSKRHLIQNKRSVARTKDLADLEILGDE